MSREIITYSNRLLPSECGDRLMVRVKYVDEPATISTWNSNTGIIGSEEGIDFQWLVNTMIKLRFKLLLSGFEK